MPSSGFVSDAPLLQAASPGELGVKEGDLVTVTLPDVGQGWSQVLVVVNVVVVVIVVLVMVKVVVVVVKESSLATITPSPMWAWGKLSFL